MQLLDTNQGNTPSPESENVQSVLKNCGLTIANIWPKYFVGQPFVKDPDVLVKSYCPS